MKNFEGKIAVVTGGGTGMGRELVRLLAADGCHVALCDISADAMVETVALASAEAPDGVRLSTFVADVSSEADLIAFRDAVASEHDTDRINLLFNNAGIGGAGSIITDAREDWEKVYNVCFGGVYLGTRTFLPMLMAADDAHVVNTSSINGFWAAITPGTPHTAYSTAKFAVKGFSEALITDFQVNAPHIKVSVVMPGHIGTPILRNSNKALGRDPKEMTEAQMTQVRSRVERGGLDLTDVSDEDLRAGLIAAEDGFQDNAPTTARQAAEIILAGVREDRWRILVGDDAIDLDARVRRDPERAYEPDFFPNFNRVPQESTEP